MNTNPEPHRPTRRDFLRGGSTAATLGWIAGLQALGAASASGQQQRVLGARGYGPLEPTPDGTTGLPLLRLPAGFRYRSFGWRFDPLTDGNGTSPERPDGMAVVSTSPAGVVTLIRNHERFNTGAVIPGPGTPYDSRGRGGATRLSFDTVSGQWLSNEIVLRGTSGNCGGGPTPWGTWLSGEETFDGPPNGFTRTHGWVFEVPATGVATNEPIRPLGRFRHEALCVDPYTGLIYETEDDRYTSGFYRFHPRLRRPKEQLVGSGLLEMLKVRDVNNADLMLVSQGETFQVDWVPILRPGMPPQSGVGPYGSTDGSTTSASGPFFQGFEAGGAQFRRLEGCWFDRANRLIYFTDTEGGFARSGVVWCLDPSRKTLTAVYVSPGSAVLDNPDNITVSPRGGLVLCEDGGQARERLHALSPQGELFLLAENDVVLQGEVNGISGNYRTREWCGATFDPTGRWMFVNIQTPGITFAITGPWERGPL